MTLYHFTECGLDNVWLVNGYNEIDTAYGKAKVQGVSEQNVSLWERHGKIPKANDTLLRLYFLAHASGDESVRSAFDRIMTVERLVHQKIVATSGRKGWKFTVEETRPSDEAPAVAG